MVTHTLNKASMSRSRPDPAAPLAYAEARKISYASSVCARAGIDFQPLAVDTFGGFGKQAEDAIHEVVKHAQLLRGSGSLQATHVRQRLQVAVFRGVARQLLRRITHHDEDEVEEVWLSDGEEDLDTVLQE